MSTFLGIGLGPIQSGIFLSGAAKGNFSRIAIAEVDDNVIAAVREADGCITINIAGSDSVYTERIDNIEIYNPQDAEGKEKLIEIAAEADEFATALPSVNFFKYVAEWLTVAFKSNPDKTRFIYTAENHNHAAELFQEAVNMDLPNTHFLNTVVGKMSGVVSQEECEKQNLEKLCPASDRGHLVEEFNKILISSAPGIEQRQVQNLLVKDNLYPFEEAKLYGHNAIHFLLGILGKQKGRKTMSELRHEDDLMAIARDAFINESGKALCKKWNGLDELFTESGFQAYADDLLVRMTNPFLNDAIDRITRDLPRKLGWDDRVIGTMRVIMQQDVEIANFAKGAALAAEELFGSDATAIRKGFEELWPSP